MAAAIAAGGNHIPANAVAIPVASLAMSPAFSVGSADHPSGKAANHQTLGDAASFVAVQRFKWE
jgi:hypothetical protein